MVLPNGELLHFKESIKYVHYIRFSCDHAHIFLIETTSLFSLTETTVINSLNGMILNHRTGIT